MLPNFLLNTFADDSGAIKKLSVVNNTLKTVSAQDSAINIFHDMPHFSGDTTYLPTWLQQKHRVATKSVEKITERSVAGPGHLVNVLSLLAIQNTLSYDTIRLFLEDEDIALTVNDFIEPAYMDFKDYLNTWYTGYYTTMGDGELFVADAPMKVLIMDIMTKPVHAIYVPISPHAFILATRNAEESELFSGYMLIDDLNTLTLSIAEQEVYMPTSVKEIRETSSPYYRFNEMKPLGIRPTAIDYFETIRQRKFPNIAVDNL